MKMYKLKFNKALNESKRHFKNLQIGNIIQISPHLLWNIDETSFYKVKKYKSDLFVVLSISSNEFSIIEECDYDFIVKFLH